MSYLLEHARTTIRGLSVLTGIPGRLLSVLCETSDGPADWLESVVELLRHRTRLVGEGADPGSCGLTALVVSAFLAGVIGDRQLRACQWLDDWHALCALETDDRSELYQIGDSGQWQQQSLLEIKRYIS